MYVGHILNRKNKKVNGQYIYVFDYLSFAQQEVLTSVVIDIILS